jgi:hypothetical protein
VIRFSVAHSNPFLSLSLSPSHHFTILISFYLIIRTFFGTQSLNSQSSPKKSRLNCPPESRSILFDSGPCRKITKSYCAGARNHLEVAQHLSLTSKWMSQLRLRDLGFSAPNQLHVHYRRPNCRDGASHIPTPQWLKSHQSPAGTSGRYHETSSAFSYRPMSDLAATNTPSITSSDNATVAFVSPIVGFLQG